MTVCVCVFIHGLSHRGLGAGNRPQEYGHAGLIFTQEWRGYTLVTVLSHFPHGQALPHEWKQDFPWRNTLGSREAGKEVGLREQLQSLGCIRLFVTPWTVAQWVPLSSTISWSLLKFLSIQSVMLPNHLIVCHPLLLLPSLFPSIKVFSNESAFPIRSVGQGEKTSLSKDKRVSWGWTM